MTGGRGGGAAGGGVLHTCRKWHVFCARWDWYGHPPPRPNKPVEPADMRISPPHCVIRMEPVGCCRFNVARERDWSGGIFTYVVKLSQFLDRVLEIPSPAPTTIHVREPKRVPVRGWGWAGVHVTGLGRDRAGCVSRSSLVHGDTNGRSDVMVAASATRVCGGGQPP